jgi:hypothetical protein
MMIGDLSCDLHMPPATKSRFDDRGEELTQHLAPYAPVKVYSVDDFPNCPADWLRSDPSLGVMTYFVPAIAGNMVWFDLRANEHHSHHVAAIISAQGINAVTGARMPAAVLDQRLEQYQDACPIHNIPFTGPKKFCRECKHEWCDQNYLATTMVQAGQYWRDGFCGKDGQTREFIFTKETSRGVAAHLIGEDRVNAFGVALFKSNEPKPPQPMYRHPHTKGFDFESVTLGATRGALSFSSMEVGAGALVNQAVGRDEKRLDFWNNTPAAAFVIYYVDAEQFAAITGFESEDVRSSSPEGFLDGIPVGNKT